MKRSLAAAALAFPLILPLAAAESEWHWKSDMTIPGTPAMSSETWIKGDRVRVVAKTPIGPAITIIKGRTAYVKNPDGTAAKTKIDLRKGLQPADLARNLEGLLKKGTKVGAQTVDGEECDVWKVTRGGASASSPDMTLWVSPSLHFPRQVVLSSERGEITIKNHDIEQTVSLPDRDFEPDASVTYEEVPDSSQR